MSQDQDVIAVGDAERTAYVLDIIRTTLQASGQLAGDGSRLNGLRVLDLACRTGSFSVALADAGATVLGIEGKAANFKTAQRHQNVVYRNRDVRDLLNVVKGEVFMSDHQFNFDRFDVGLCLGILYHLDAVDAVKLLTDLRQVTTGFAIVDTHIGSPLSTVTVNGQQYHGWWYEEPGAGEETRWSSVGNAQSFWFSDRSLVAAAQAAGWGQVTQLPGVRFDGEPIGRRWLVLQ